MEATNVPGVMRRASQLRCSAALSASHLLDTSPLPLITFCSLQKDTPRLYHFRPGHLRRFQMTANVSFGGNDTFTYTARSPVKCGLPSSLRGRSAAPLPSGRASGPSCDTCTAMNENAFVSGKL